VIIVVGAGPAGLAMAYELQRRGLAYRVLERERVGAAWTHHYDRLHLHTLKAVSGLPGLPMPASYPSFPSAAQFHAYLRAYATHFALKISTGVSLERADFAQGQWQLHTSAGPLSAKLLVLATGIWSAPVRPAIPGEAEFGGPIIHSRDYHNPQPYAGQRVLVVGTGARLAARPLPGSGLRAAAGGGGRACGNLRRPGAPEPRHGPLRRRPRYALRRGDPRHGLSPSPG